MPRRRHITPDSDDSGQDPDFNPVDGTESEIESGVDLLSENEEELEGKMSCSQKQSGHVSRQEKRQPQYKHRRFASRTQQSTGTAKDPGEENQQILLIDDQIPGTQPCNMVRSPYYDTDKMTNVPNKRYPNYICYWEYKGKKVENRDSRPKERENEANRKLRHSSLESDTELTRDSRPKERVDEANRVQLCSSSESDTELNRDSRPKERENEANRKLRHSSLESDTELTRDSRPKERVDEANRVQLCSSSESDTELAIAGPSGQCTMRRSRAQSSSQPRVRKLCPVCSSRVVDINRHLREQHLFSNPEALRVSATLRIGVKAKMYACPVHNCVKSIVRVDKHLKNWHKLSGKNYQLYFQKHQKSLKDSNELPTHTPKQNLIPEKAKRTLRKFEGYLKSLQGGMRTARIVTQHSSQVKYMWGSVTKKFKLKRLFDKSHFENGFLYPVLNNSVFQPGTVMSYLSSMKLFSLFVKILNKIPVKTINIFQASFEWLGQFCQKILKNKTCCKANT